MSKKIKKEVDIVCENDAILVVGLVCVDIILICSHYPAEDSSNRCIKSVKRRGGNGSNSCTVLSQLGAKCEILAPFAGDDYAEFLKKDLTENSIEFSHGAVYPDCETPFTNIVVSLATGSRTGVHTRSDSFPENSPEDFNKIDLSGYSWIHFEGRCIEETKTMMSRIDTWNKGRPGQRLSYSVELEKCKEDTKLFIPLAEFIFVSKDFANFMGFTDMHSTIHGLTPLIKPGAVIIVPWGDQGAAARCSDGEIVHSNAFPPPKVLDSVGAGDTFIAASIFYLSKGKSVAASIEFACKIAGAKVGKTGFKHIHDVYESMHALEA